MVLAKIGKKVTDIKLAATSNQTLQLSDFKGKKIVLYFYPKDSTPGCTLEGQDFRDNKRKFSARNTIVLGVSRDSIKSHKNFKNKQAFPFDLLSRILMKNYVRNLMLSRKKICTAKKSLA